MKKLLIILILLAIGTAISVSYFSLQKIEKRYYRELNHMAYQNWIDVSKSGLLITDIGKESILHNVQFLDDSGLPTHSGALAVGDSITGVALDQQKTSLLDFIRGKRFYAHFLPENSEEKLYTTIIKLGSDTVLLGIVRSEGTGLKHSIVRVSLGELCKDGKFDLGIIVESNAGEPGQERIEESENFFNFKQCYAGK